jgi:hypothetical protein
VISASDIQIKAQVGGVAQHDYFDAEKQFVGSEAVRRVYILLLVLWLT